MLSWDVATLNVIRDANGSAESATEIPNVRETTIHRSRRTRSKHPRGKQANADIDDDTWTATQQLHLEKKWIPWIDLHSVSNLHRKHQLRYVYRCPVVITLLTWSPSGHGDSKLGF